MNTDHSARAHSYDSLFYEYPRQSSARSAYARLPLLKRALGPKSVIDIGCAAGAWLMAYDKLGISDFIGVDGDCVNRTLLLIDQRRFVPTDISKPVDPGRRFDVAQCVEVGKHVPSAASESLVDNITRDMEIVLFSAPVPRQAREDYINERPYEHWRDLFVAHGSTLFDFLRHHIQRLAEIERRYCQSVLLFAHEVMSVRLSPDVAPSRIPDNAPNRDFSSVRYRIREARP